MAGSLRRHDSRPPLTRPAPVAFRIQSPEVRRGIRDEVPLPTAFGAPMRGSLLRSIADLAAGAGRLLGRVPPLDPAALGNAADISFDLDPGAIEPLAALCDSIREDLDLAPRGRLLLGGRFIEILRSRRRLIEREAAGELPPVPESIPPIVVTGFPRSGTTLSHRILALAPEVRAPTWCELMQPSLERGIEPSRARTRRLRTARLAVRTLDLLAPDLRHIHELVANGPEECTHLHELALDSESFALLGPVDRYRSWLDDRDATRRAERYEWQDRCLRAIHADRLPEHRGERWVLKAPQHLCQLDDLLDRFPGATIVRMHRDPIDAMASTGSLVACASIIPTRGLPPGHGDDLLEIFTEWQERGDEAMARHPDRILEIHYQDLVHDPVEFVERVHAFAGVPFLPEHAHAVRAHLRSRPKHHFGRHRYRLEDRDLDPVAVRERLSGYIERIESIRGLTGD